MRAAVLPALCVHLLLLTAASSVRIPPGYPDRTTSRTVDYLPVEESDWVRTQATYAAQLASRVAHDEVSTFIQLASTQDSQGRLQSDSTQLTFIRACSRSTLLFLVIP